MNKHTTVIPAKAGIYTNNGSPIRSGMTNKVGFTLVELLVAITIVAILSTVGLVIYRSTIDQAKLAKTQTKIRELRIMMENYRSKNNVLPPGSGYSTEDASKPGWNVAGGPLATLETAGILSSVDRPKYATDEWGKPFHFVNNDGVSSTKFSLFWTEGPNKTSERSATEFSAATNYFEGKNCGTDDWCLDLPYGK